MKNEKHFSAKPKIALSKEFKGCVVIKTLSSIQDLFEIVETYLLEIGTPSAMKSQKLM